ncbi:hypothetical protein M8J75_007482 [Diaphorina citri]|nr:hypothetical protein M8J75_007482 [Diaphorina citri]
MISHFKSNFILFNPYFWAFLGSVSCLYYIWTRRKLYYLSWQLPGPLPLPILGSTFFVWFFGVSNVFPILKIAFRHYAPHKIIRVWFGGELMILVADPSVIAQVNTLTLTKADIYQYLGYPYLKKGMFVDKDIPHWKASKKVITQVFVFKVLKQYIKIFHEESIILVNKLQELAYSGQPFYPPKCLELATFNSIMRTTLGVNPNAQINEHQPFIDALHNIFQHFQRKLFLPILRNNFVYSLFGWRQDEERNIGILLDLAHTVLEDLKTDMKNTTDIMRESRTSLAELLLQQPHISMEELKAQIVTVIGAGLDTSMIQNSMVLIMLATHPAVQEKVFEEMVQVLGEDINVLPSYEDLMKLEYLERVIKECLRMYPAAPFTGRHITEDIKVTTEDGKEYIFPAGVAVGNLLNLVQKSPDYYENPRVFDPDRWLPENSVNRNPHCYIPFSSGPRNCIGGKYAILQMRTMLSAILRKYKVLPSESCKSLRDNPYFWVFLVSVTCLYYIWSRRKLYYLSWQLPGPLPLPILGSTLFIWFYGVSNVFPLIKIVFKQYAPHKIIRVWFGGELMVLVADPSVIAQVNTLTLTKTDVYQYLGDPYLKKGIFVDKDIPHWKASKKVITQVFVFKVLKQYIKIFHEESIILVNKLQELAYSGQPFYPPKYLELATFNSIMRTTLGVNPNAQINEHQPFIHAVHNVFQHFQRKLFLPILRNNFVYSLFGWRQDEERNMGIVLDLAHTVLEDLKTDMKNSTDIMRESRTSLAELLLQQPDISMKEVEAQIVTVIGAGLDTSMIQNSMVLIMLATHPAVQEKVFEEMVQVLGEDINVLPSYEDLMKLEYLERVIKECLRMYPAAPFTGRKITEDIKVTTEDGKEYIFPAGVAIGNLLYHVQKSPDYYENPRVFDPDRWLPENSVNRNPHCYIPFSSGPRNCIGGKYAILQMKTIVSAILRKYKVLPSESCKTLRDVRNTGGKILDGNKSVDFRGRP